MWGLLVALIPGLDMPFPLVSVGCSDSGWLWAPGCLVPEPVVPFLREPYLSLGFFLCFGWLIRAVALGDCWFPLPIYRCCFLLKKRVFPKGRTNSAFLGSSQSSIGTTAASSSSSSISIQFYRNASINTGSS
ncbi:hypothetical protein M5K25_026568 [Dendrobium thyrsiflorum]|uniref:Secreted protein n=1 Tax=Dendrobium thyrsiflorum TaxID=117978 RepID=A0ABD0TXV2_DENTH